MNINHLRFFLAAAEEGSLTAAAERCFVTQPTLSAGLKSLENQLGGQLLLRSKQGVSLTAFGNLQLKTCREIIHRANRLLSAKNDDNLGLLRVAVSAALPAGILSAALGEYLVPTGLKIRVMEIENSTAESVLQQGKADVVLYCHLGAPPAMSLALGEDCFGLAVADSHPLAARKRLTASSIANESMIVRMHSEETDKATAVLRSNGLKPQVIARVNSDERSLALVKAGLGVCVMPMSMAAEQGVTVIPVQGFNYRRSVLLQWNDHYWGKYFSKV